jgi:hypothetical protein
MQNESAIRMTRILTAFSPAPFPSVVVVIFVVVVIVVVVVTSSRRRRLVVITRLVVRYPLPDVFIVVLHPANVDMS